MDNNILEMSEEQLAEEVDNMWNRQTTQIRNSVSDGLKGVLNVRLQNNEENKKKINIITNYIKTNSPTQTWTDNPNNLIELGYSRIEFLRTLYRLLSNQEIITERFNQRSQPRITNTPNGGKRRRNKKSKRRKSHKRRKTHRRK